MASADDTVRLVTVSEPATSSQTASPNAAARWSEDPSAIASATLRRKDGRLRRRYATDKRRGKVPKPQVANAGWLQAANLILS